MTTKRLLLPICLFLATTGMALAQGTTTVPPVVMAAVPGGWIELTTSWVCQDNGAVLNFILHYGWTAMIALVPALASIAGNFRNKMSPTTVKYLDAVSLDFASSLRSKAVAAEQAAGTPSTMSGVTPPPTTKP
jgi:hypothetical protein